MRILKILKRWHANQSKRSLVRGFWHGAPLRALHWACLRSFLKADHAFELFTYQRLDVPNGVRLRDASAVLPKERMFFLKNRHTGQADVAPFADYFRLKVLYRYGGWWCDVDTICLSPELPSGERVWSRQAPDYRPSSVSNGQLFFKSKRDWVALQLLLTCEQSLNAFKRREDLGPELMSNVLGDLGLPLDMGATAAVFYPIRYIENFKLWLPEFADEVMEKIDSAIFLPIYQSFPTHLGFDYSKLPPVGSFLYHFIRQEAPEFPNIAHDADEFRRAIRIWLQNNRQWAISRLVSVSKDNIMEWVES